MLTGEADVVGAMLPAFLSEIYRPGTWIHRPALMIFGGETPVHIHGNGLGGRNQELALAAVRPMSDMKGSALVTLATDGEDGPTDAAGAFVSDETLQKGLAHGLKPEDFLNRNDAYHYFEALNDLLKTGPSGTNVNDLTFLFAF
jgi:hydroxypyruvate reductase